ncbi:MAG TPA: alpha/beta hydrolase family protein [Pyrinomonadaceae bacterium]|jgi:S-formylglutathione hydrolase FrmB
MRLSIKNHFAKFFGLVLVLTFSFSVNGQKASTKAEVNQTAPQLKASVAVRDLKLNSKLMAREMPYRVILPTEYENNKTEKYAVVYLLHGLTGHFDNWADKTKLKDYAANYRYIIVTPEGNNGWYTDSATVASDKYESYIVKELIPEIDKNFRTIADRNHRVIAGLSMGGYGSLKFGLKYPEMFSLAGSFSGALQAASFTDKILGNSWKALTDSIMSVYGAEDSQSRKENDIYKITRELSAEKMKTLPFFYLDCGTEDGLIASNREFAALLLEKKIPHEFRQLPGRHNWQFWNSQVKEFLELTEKHFSQTQAKAN